MDYLRQKILQNILEEKWCLDPGDKDMIIMQHQFDYRENGTRKKIYSTLSYIGADTYNTAMAATVGLPVAITARLILEEKINLKGVHLPIMKEVYNPVLKELESHGIRFVEEEISMPLDTGSL